MDKLRAYLCPLSVRKENERKKQKPSKFELSYRDSVRKWLDEWKAQEGISEEDEEEDDEEARDDDEEGFGAGDKANQDGDELSEDDYQPDVEFI